MENLSVLLWRDLFSKCIQEWILHFIKTLHITEHSHNFRNNAYYWELCLIFILNFFSYVWGPRSCLHLRWWIIPLPFALFVSWRCYWLGIGPLGLSRFYTSLGIIFIVIFPVVFCSTAFSSCPSTFLPKAGNKWDETVNAPLLTPDFC